MIKKAPPMLDRVTYCRTFPGKWKDVSEWISVDVEYFPPEHGWEAVCSVGFPNERRSQWNTRKVFADRDDAARFAADFVVVAEGLIVAVERGETPYMPHRGMKAACDAALEVDAKLVELAAAIESATDQRSRSDLRGRLDSARRLAIDEWYRAHDWRDFRTETLTKETAAA